MTRRTGFVNALPYTMSDNKRVHSISLQIYVLFLFLQSYCPVFFHNFRVKSSNCLREIDFQIR